ncbi:MAG: hypothetical protein R2932_29185, partial [Caldilineaceae bacterium]
SRAYESIQQGQAAYLRTHSRDDEQMAGDISTTRQTTSVAIPAVVANILGPPVDEHFRISLSIQPDATTTTLLEQNPTGEVTVEVERVSPAKLVARASGQLVDSPSLSFSPQ